ncbi:MAG TPA: efflux transporter outer membrane subunit [Casimicrobiaceae bacterium]|nr:efflux transporter outer membrane subunit [Casimicrobiaceae bacterium]
MRRSRTLRRCCIWVVAGSAILAGCTTVGPDFAAPAAPGVEGYTRGKLPAATASAPAPLGEAQRLGGAEAVPREWWRQFGSAKLDDLVARALAHSPTLAAAEATLRQAKQTYAAQAGSTLYPTVNGRLGASRNQTESSGSGLRNGTGNLYSLYNAGISVNYNLDLFGGNRRQLEALAAQADYEGFQLAAARLALAGNVVTAAFSQAQFAAQVDATEAIIKAQQDQLDIARKRFELGASARSEVLTLETQLEQNRASLPLLVNRMQQADHLLAVLIGQAPGAVDIPRFALSDFTLPQSLPVVVPSELVRGRPDIQASAALLHVATAQYGVAVASLYPQINLSAALGTQALTVGGLFGPGTLVWALAGQLAQPLFDAGLKSAANAAEASLQAAGANYEQTVLLALRSVADALRTLESDAKALEAQAAADAAAQESLTLVEQQYELGAASYLQLLISQQQARQTRVFLILAQAQRLADTAALYQAMGGGTLTGADPDRTARTE